MEYWNHNTAYYKWIKKQVIHCSRILDVGCGDGSLIGFLDDCNKHLTGIDSYEPCIKKAKSQFQSERCDFYCDDFLEHSFDCKFDAIIFVASIHHMNMRKALEKAKSLLDENGVILIVGLGKPSSFLDYIIECSRVIPSFIISKCKKIHSCEDENIPVSYELPAMNEIRNIKNEVLVGAKIRDGLFYRYLVKWEKSNLNQY